MRSLAGKPPLHMPEYRAADYDCLNLKLKTYYARKRKLYADTYPNFYDADLRQLFSATAGPGRITAAAYLRRRRRRLLNSVCQWTNEKKRDEDRRDPHRHEPFIADMTRRMKC